MKSLIRVVGVVVFVLAAMSAICGAQHKGQPGKFDFYLMNLSWAPEFCSVPGASAECKVPPKGFILHGLWAQNYDGTYPVFCSERPGPEHPEKNLDITPDLELLKHEWAKHGTCTTLSPDTFFAQEHKAYTSFKVPELLLHLDHEVQMEPAEIIDLFGRINPGFPAGSILLSCGNNRLTAIEACLSKDLKPVVCEGLRTCRANVVKITPPTQR
jgi:ribonuclease T2